MSFEDTFLYQNTNLEKIQYLVTSTGSLVVFPNIKKRGSHLKETDPVPSDGQVRVLPDKVGVCLRLSRKGRKS